MSRASDHYIAMNLGRHLVEGGLCAELFWLVSDVRWILRRRVQGGWAGLEEDLNMAIAACEASESKLMNEQECEGLKILRSVLHDTWGEFWTDPHTIGFEVFTRISCNQSSSHSVEHFLSSIKVHGPKPWLHPSRSIFAQKDLYEVSQVRIPGNINHTCLSNDGRFFVNVTSDGAVVLLDVRTQESNSFSVTSLSKVTAVSFSAVTRKLALGFESGDIEIYGYNDFRLVRRKIEHAHQSTVRCLAFDVDGQRLSSGSEDMTSRVWSSETGDALCDVLTGHNNFIECLTISCNHLLASGSNDNEIHLWNLETGFQTCEPLKGHLDSVTRVSFSHTGRLLASGSLDKTIRIWNVSTGELLGTPLALHRGYIHCTAFYTNDTCLISGSSDRTMMT